MRILSIETSCDETAISVVDAGGNLSDTTFQILGDKLLSQIELHREYGGVYPSLAKREHAKNLVPVLTEALRSAELLEEHKTQLDESTKNELEELLSREPELFKQLSTFFETTGKPDIDAIAVTEGPGLEPALWVGINFAKALAHVWKIDIIPVNHMEGHIFAGLMTPSEDESYKISNVKFPLLALLISGGHTELVLTKSWGEYELLGRTRDDAVGEAFDKVARILGLPYPGGPEIARLAQEAREANQESVVTLPRPMLRSEDLDFSFSGLKTAVLYHVRNTNPDEKEKKAIAREFEDAVTEVLVAKTMRALEESGAQTLVVGGGVSANTHIREELEKHAQADFPDVDLLIPELTLTTDNAIMIGIAGYYSHLLKKDKPDTIKARGNLSLES